MSIGRGADCRFAATRVLVADFRSRPANRRSSHLGGRLVERRKGAVSPPRIDVFPSVPDRQSCRVLWEPLRLSNRTSTGSVVHGAGSAALVLAVPCVNLANGGAERAVGGSGVLHRRGRWAVVAA
jgi:hypothetical protein